MTDRYLLPLLVLTLMLPSRLALCTQGTDAATVPIHYIIILYLENHTFDNLYGKFPGANGLDSPAAIVPQVDKEGRMYRTLPRPVVSLDYTGLPAPWRDLPAFPDRRFPADLPNAPFNIDRHVPSSEFVWSPVHRFYQYQLQINDGKMDKFVAWTDSGGLPMGYYDTTQLPLYPYARQYTLADNFFTAALGGSFLNHFWLVCACTPVWPNAPKDIVAKPVYDHHGRLIGLKKDGLVTPDGFAVNTGVESVFSPHNPRTPKDHLLPAQTFPTIGDRLSAAGVRWAFYAGGWNNALAGHPDQPVPFVPVPMLNPLAYFAQYGDGTTARAEHLKDAVEFLADLGRGTLPAVSFIKPAPVFDAHPGYSVLQLAEEHAVDLIEAVQGSRYWPESVVIDRMQTPATREKAV